jgi:hypothetical protein
LDIDGAALSEADGEAVANQPGPVQGEGGTGTVQIGRQEDAASDEVRALQNWEVISL